MRKVIPVVVAGALALAACSTSKEDAADSSVVESASSTEVETTDAVEPTVAPVVDDRAPGVTETSIKVGITYVDLSKLKAILGFDHGDYETAYRAIIDDINARGGVNGRTIEPVFVPVDPSGTDAATAACTQLTEDEEVFIAVGFFLDDETLCYVETNETLVIGGPQTAERLGKAKVGWWTFDAAEDRSREGFEALLAEDRISSSVAVVGAATDQSAYETVLAPMLENAGIAPVGEAFIDTTADSAVVYADAATAAERFKADGADQVIVLGNAGGFFMEGLGRTNWRPQVVFESADSAGAFFEGEGNDLSLLEGALTVGGFDSGNLYGTLGSPTAECIALQEAAGLVLKPTNEIAKGESQQIVSSLVACRTMALLVAGLEAAGPTLNYGTFTTAINSLGEVMIPGFDEPLFFGSPPSADGDPRVYVYEWDSVEARMVLAQ